jgi:hypothetical protein
MDLRTIAPYLDEHDNYSLKLEVLWDKHNSGLLCSKIFTLVDRFNLWADIKIVSANSIELLISLASAAAGGVAGAVVKELIAYLIKRKKTAPEELHKTIIFINDHSININAVYHDEETDLLE